jgi:hypothetical protein
MKKTTLLIIGALAFVLQSATAQPYLLYSQDFESQDSGTTPQNQDGNGMWTWAGNATSSTWDVESVGSGEVTTQAAVLSWALSGATWTGFSSGDSITYIPGDKYAPDMGNELSDITFSMDIAVVGAGGTQPVAIWFNQFPNGAKNLNYEFDPVLTTDGSWNHITVRMDNVANHGGTYDAQYGFVIDMDSGLSGMAYADGVDKVTIDNIQMWAANPIPEPSTIALLTLGGLGALVGIRRRRA